MKKLRAVLFVSLFLSLTTLSLLFINNLQAESAGAQAELLTTYDIPGTVGKPLNLTVRSDGTTKIIWFTLPEEDALGQLVITDSTTFEINKFSVSANSEPHDLIFDGSDTIWFTLRNSNALGRINVFSKAITEIAIPNGNEPVGIDIAPNGNIWISQKSGNRITRFVPGSSTFTDFVYTTTGGQLDEIEVMNNDSIWFTAPGRQRIVELKPSTPKFTNVPVQLLPGSPAFAPTGLSLDATDPWTSSSTNGLIGRRATGTLSFWIWFELQIQNFAPTKIEYVNKGANKLIWFVDPTNGLAGRIRTDVNGELQDFYYTGLEGGATAVPTDLEVDGNDTVWIANNGSGQIVQWNAPHFNFTFIPVLFR